MSKQSACLISNYTSTPTISQPHTSQKRRYKTMSKIWGIRVSTEHHVAAGEREMTNARLCSFCINLLKNNWNKVELIGSTFSLRIAK